MLLAISVTLFCGVLCAALAVAMRLREVPHLSRADVVSEAAFSDERRNRRSPFNRFLRLVGRFNPGMRRLSREQRHQPVYVGCRLTKEEFGGLIVCAMAGGAVAAAVIAREFGQTLTVIAPVVGAAIGWCVVNMWLRSAIQGRRKAILRILPEAVDLLALCVGAGLDFLGSLNRVVSAKAFSGEPIIEELTIALQEMKLGKRRAEALKDMAKRVNLQEMNSFVRTIVQADRMGTPIAEVLVIHAEDVRLQRFVRAEREALKAPLKLLVPLIFFIMPCVAIIVGAPIFLQFMHGSPLGK